MSCRRLPKSKLLTTALLAVLPVLAAQASPQAQLQAQLQDRGRGQPQRDDLRPPPRGSLSDAVRQVERNTRGEVLSAERVQYDGRDMHRVKVVDDQGRVRVFMQDPQRRGGTAGRPSRDDDEDN